MNTASGFVKYAVVKDRAYLTPSHIFSGVLRDAYLYSNEILARSTARAFNGKVMQVYITLTLMD